MLRFVQIVLCPGCLMIGQAQVPYQNLLISLMFKRIDVVDKVIYSGGPYNNCRSEGYH